MLVYISSIFLCGYSHGLKESSWQPHQSSINSDNSLGQTLTRPDPKAPSITILSQSLIWVCSFHYIPGTLEPAAAELLLLRCSVQIS